MTHDTRISEDVLGVPPSLMNKSTRAALVGYLCSENTKKELEILPAVEREELLSLCGNDEITASSIHSQLVTLKMAALQSPESLRARSIPGNYKALLSFIRSEVRSRVMSSTPPAECLPHTIAIPYFSDWDDEVLCYVRAGRCSETLLVFAQSLDGTWRLAYGEDNPRLVAPKRDKILENQMAIVNLRDPE